jgi:hypothetical protein
MKYFQTVATRFRRSFSKRWRPRGLSLPRMWVEYRNWNSLPPLVAGQLRSDALGADTGARQSTFRFQRLSVEWVRSFPAGGRGGETTISSARANSCRRKPKTTSSLDAPRFSLTVVVTFELRPARHAGRHSFEWVASSSLRTFFPDELWGELGVSSA